MINDTLIFYTILNLAGVLYYFDQIELHTGATHHSAGRIRSNKTCRSAKRKQFQLRSMFLLPFLLPFIGIIILI